MIQISAMDTRSPHLGDGKLWIMAVHSRTRDVVGHLSLRDLYPDDEKYPAGQTVWVNDLFVRRTHRRKGIARRLLQSAEFYSALLVADMNPTINAGIDIANTPSRDLFAGLGYKFHCHFESEPGNKCVWVYKDLPRHTFTNPLPASEAVPVG